MTGLNEARMQIAEKHTTVPQLVQTCTLPYM